MQILKTKPITSIERFQREKYFVSYLQREQKYELSKSDECIELLRVLFSLSFCDSDLNRRKGLKATAAASAASYHGCDLRVARFVKQFITKRTACYSSCFSRFRLQRIGQIHTSRACRARDSERQGNCRMPREDRGSRYECSFQSSSLPRLSVKISRSPCVFSIVVFLLALLRFPGAWLQPAEGARKDTSPPSSWSNLAGLVRSNIFSFLHTISNFCILCRCQPISLFLSPWDTCFSKFSNENRTNFYTDSSTVNVSLGQGGPRVAILIK